MFIMMSYGQDLEGIYRRNKMDFFCAFSISSPKNLKCKYKGKYLDLLTILDYQELFA